MNKNLIRRIIKEELKRKPLNEMGRGYYSDYPRGGEDEDEGYESELDYCLSYGLDLPKDHPSHSQDFKQESMDEDWRSARAEVLGEEYADTPFENGKYLTGAAKAEWRSQGSARRY